MVSCCGQHGQHPRTCALLTELHLEDRIVYRLPGNLSPKLVQFAMRNVETGSRVFMLQSSSELEREKKVEINRTDVVFGFLGFLSSSKSFLLDTSRAVEETESNMLVWPSAAAFFFAASFSSFDCCSF